MASTHSKPKLLRALFLFGCLFVIVPEINGQPAPAEGNPELRPAAKPENADSIPKENKPSDSTPANNNIKDEAKQETSVPPSQPLMTAEEQAAKERAEAEARKAAAEAARIAEEKRIEAERTWFDKLLLNSKLYTGLNAGMVIPLNSLHSAGYGFGMTIDYLAYQRYGFHFGAETGLLPAKSGALQAGATLIRISDQGTMGYLNLRFAGLYAFPKVFDVETAAGLGVSVYRLNSGTYSFNTAIAPVVLGTAYYNLFASLQVGLIAQVVLPSVSTLSSPGSEFTLDSSQSLATASLHASVRYVWF